MISVLDHGYVKFIESWGGGEVKIAEAGMVEAARQSTQGSFRGWEKDEALLRRLHIHKHSSPFEFAGMVLEIKAPIAVFREWHRHRTQSYNEMSARYAPLPDTHYLPTVERCLVKPGKNTQANPMKGSEELTEEKTIKWLDDLDKLFKLSQLVYHTGLTIGIPKEVARGATTVFRYSKMRASANLRNWLAFLTLRMHPDAQWEIRQYANVVGKIIEEQFPRTWSLFSEDKL